MPGMDGVSKEDLARHATALILHGLVRHEPGSVANNV
jgi:hypothetical protein